VDLFLIRYQPSVFCFTFFLHHFRLQKSHNHDFSLNVDAHAENREYSRNVTNLVRAFQFGSLSEFYIHSEALHDPTENCEEK